MRPIGFCLAAAFVSCSQKAEPEIERPPAASVAAKGWDGRRRQGQLPAGGHRDFRLVLPPASGYFRLELAGVGDDVDLRLARTQAELESEDWHRSSAGSGTDEEIELLRDGEAAWADGAMFVRVENAEDEPVDFVLRARVVVHDGVEVVAPGVRVQGEIQRRAGYRHCVRVAVPATAEAVRLDLHGVRHDIDLYASHANGLFDTADAEHWADSMVACESLVITTESEPPLQPGSELWVVVQDGRVELEDLEFELHVTAGRRAPAAIDSLRVPPLAVRPMQRALSSVVALTDADGTASGTIVRRDGLILTASHCIDEDWEDDVVVALTVDPRELPQEMFRCRLVQRREDLDLALMQIDRTLYGTPLTEPLQLPSCPVDFDAELGLGQPLYSVGYPGIGGETARTTVSWSRGMVVGFDPRPAATEIKTDALISSGSSGGAALGGGFALVGVVQSAIEEDEGSAQLGFVMPVTALPRSWRRRIER